eukprot:TRINITY_DN9554_c0_g1_i1.p1 TRINITY_DN9554_c0_g1~~TRINITY_DN9554_c0_g1_i1.p1  ORF type:complete len:229 (-),score=53.99 TRINITY_DN9554_c0_g1_i1:57-743(-)
MIAQQQTICPECKGQKEVIKPQDRCATCNGEKTVEESKIIEVKIEKGMKQGEKIIFPEESNEEPGYVTGDVIIVVKQRPHKDFQRSGDHLFIERKITLVEALSGLELTIPHLDGRVLLIKTESGEVIKPGEVREIKNEGMPIRKHPKERGNLYVKFEIEFPDKFNDKYAREIRHALGQHPKKPKYHKKDVTPVKLHVFEGFTKEQRRKMRKRDSDEEEEGQEATCRQM